MNSKWQKMNDKVSDKQVALARKFQAAGLTSFSQAIKAFANRDNERIEAWKAELNSPAPVVEETPAPVVDKRIERAIKTVRAYRAAVVEWERCSKELAAATTAMEEAKRDAVAASKFLTPDQRIIVNDLLTDVEETDWELEYAYDSIDTNTIAERAFALANDRGFLTSGNVLLTDVDEIEAYLIETEREKIRAQYNI